MNELELLEARARVNELVDELAIESRYLRDEMLDDPQRAIRVLEHAKRARGIRNRASFAIVRWRSASSKPIPPARPVPPVITFAAPRAGAPTLEALELAWHLEELGSPIAPSVLRLLAWAIELNGGMEAVRRSFDD